MSVLPPARARLRVAIVARDGAKGRLDAAKLAAERGRELLDGAGTQLAKLGDVDAAIVSHRATQFKAAASADGRAPNLTLPAALVARERARDEARGAVAAAKAAHASLAADLEQIAKVHARAESEVGTIAVEICVEEGIAVAARLRAAWSTVFTAQDELTALAALGAGRLPPDISALMQFVAARDFRQFAGGRNPGLAAANTAWRRWHDALCADADAQFDRDGDAALAERRQEVA